MNLRFTTSLACLAILALPAIANAAPPSDPSGAWLTEDGRARIRLEKCGPANESLCGYVVWMKTPLDTYGQPRPDIKNPDVTKTERPLLGHQLILGLKPNADARYEGKIYNNEDGKKYDVNIWLNQPGELKVRGCLIAFLCSTQTWTRTTDVLPGQLTGATGTPGGPQPDAEWAVASKPSAPARREAKPRT